MKRVLVALLAISMAAGVLTGCGSKGSDKTFTVGFDAEFPLTDIVMTMENM